MRWVALYTSIGGWKLHYVPVELEKVITEDLSIETLRRIKDDVKEVKSGFECGIKLAGYDDIKVGDRLEAYVREKHERTL